MVAVSGGGGGGEIVVEQAKHQTLPCSQASQLHFCLFPVYSDCGDSASVGTAKILLFQDPIQLAFASLTVVASNAETALPQM